MEREALKLALKALEVATTPLARDRQEVLRARAAIREALAQPEQKPVAWSVIGNGKFGEYKLGKTFVDYEATHIYWKNRGYELVPVYTAPPQRPWVGLTDEEIDQFHNWKDCTWSTNELVRHVEATLRSKNT